MFLHVREWSDLERKWWPVPQPTWQPKSPVQTKQMRCGMQSLAGPLGILLSTPVWLASGLCIRSQGSRPKERALSVGWEEAMYYRLKTGIFEALANLWLSDPSDTNTPGRSLWDMRQAWQSEHWLSIYELIWLWLWMYFIIYICYVL